MSHIPGLKALPLRNEPQLYLTELNQARWQRVLERIPGAFTGLSLSVPLQTVYWVESYAPLRTHRLPFLPFVVDYLASVIKAWVTVYKPEVAEQVPLTALEVLSSAQNDQQSLLEFYESAVEEITQRIASHENQS